LEQFGILINIKYYKKQLACGASSHSSGDAWGVIHHLNVGFRDGVGSVTTPPSMWGGVCDGLGDDLLLTTSSFPLLFFLFVSHSFEIHVGHLNFQSCPHIYWYFNFGSYFFIFNFCSYPFVKFQFVFSFIIESIITIYNFFRIWSSFFWFWFFVFELFCEF
jgi:hypothetical protein